MTSLTERARERMFETAREREEVKYPIGGPSRSDSASRWELLTELEAAYTLIAELAERVEGLELEVKRDR